jgi:toxin-antitoxin system PIN domain toxin
VPIFLLDVNVLLSLAWPTHVHHSAAHRWLQEYGTPGWATCPLTQLAFVRLSMQPAVVKVPVLFGDAMESLAQSTASPAHHFWPLEYGLAGIREEIRERIAGHHQLADALLLDLAVRHAGRLATFDRRVPALLPADSPLRDVVEVIPA